MIFKIFKFLIIGLFVFIVLISMISLYIYKKYLKNDTIKNYFIREISIKNNIKLSLSKIKFIPPDNLLINDCNISNEFLNIFLKEAKINIKVYELFKKNVDIPIEKVEINEAKININISSKTKNNIIDFRKLPSIYLRNTYISIENGFFYNSYIKNLEIKKNLIFKNIFNIDGILDFESNIIKKIPIDISLTVSLEESKIPEIKIKRFITYIDNNKIEIIKLVKINSKKSYIEIKTLNDINLKKLIKIPYEIPINKFTAGLTIEHLEDIIKITSQIKEINTNISIIYDLKNKRVLKIHTESKNISSHQLKDILDRYVKKYNGKINIKLDWEKNNKQNRLIINADTNNFSFSDPFEIINFENSKIKFILNPSFYSINAISLKGNFLKKRVEGWLKADSDYLNENINSVLKINDTKIKSKIRLENLTSKTKKKFKFNLELSKFNLEEIKEISRYIIKKIEKQPSNSSAKYYMIEKPVIINLLSDNVTLLDWIKANKLIAKMDIKKFNRYPYLDGEFKIIISKGIMENINLNLEKNENYRIIFLPLKTLFHLNQVGALKIDSNLNTIHFLEIGINFYLNNAKIIIDKFYMNSEEFLIYSKGSFETDNRKIDMLAYIINPKSYKRGALPETLSDSKGRPAIAFSIKGNINNPEVKLLNIENINKIVEKEIQDGINME